MGSFHLILLILKPQAKGQSPQHSRHSQRVSGHEFSVPLSTFPSRHRSPHDISKTSKEDAISQFSCWFSESLKHGI